MTDIDIDVGVISLNDKYRLSSLRSLFPKSNVFLQRGVDLRNVSVNDLKKVDLIGYVGRLTLMRGRKWHHELNSKGGVGVAQANRLALLKDVTRPLLLFEDDYVIQNKSKFLDEIGTLLSGSVQYDMAVFGAFIIGQRGTWEREASLNSGWYVMNSSVNFYGLHAVLYSPSARERIGGLLSSTPLDMQIDSLYSYYAQTNPDFRVIVQLEDPSVVQSRHVSSIQNDTCHLCDLTPNNVLQNSTRSYLSFLVVVAGLLVCSLVFGGTKLREACRARSRRRHSQEI